MRAGLTNTLLHGGFARHPLLVGCPAPLRKSIASRFIYSSDHNFTYQRVPKAANSTITRTLAVHIFGPEAVAADAKGAQSKAKLSKLPSVKQFESSYTFTFVRDPASRVLSAWRDKAHMRKFQDRFDLEDPRNPGQPISFSAFLQRLEDGLLDKDPHWLPQAQMLAFGGKRFDFVGRIEALDAELPKVMESIFGTYKGVATRAVGRTFAQNSSSSAVKPADRALIERLYAQDYALITEVCGS